MNDQQTGQWNGQGIETEPERENIYTSLIANCFREIDQIHGKISIFSCYCEMNQKESKETPTRTELENHLQRLLTSLKYLKESIVV